MPISFDIWYVTSPSGTQPSLLKLWLCGQNGLIQDVTEFTLTYKMKQTNSPGLKPLVVRGDRDSRANLMPIYGDLYQITL